MKYSVAEFFSGCGGFSRGFARSGRFDVVLGNDVKPAALRTFAFNHRSDDIVPATILEDIRTVPLSRIENTLKERGVASGDLDCLIGGPPCQGFSQLRRTEEREDGKIVKFRGYSKLAHDPRNDLVLRFLEVAERLRPKFIVIENVPQMLNHGFGGRLGKLSETVIEILEKDLRYSVSVAVANAANYGVPQLRERALFIASAIAPASFPETTHADPAQASLIGEKKTPWVSVAAAIGDLPDPTLEHDTFGGQSISLYRQTNSEFAHLMRSAAEFPRNHVTRSYNDSVLRIIKEMRPGKTWDTESERMQKKYARIIDRYAAAHGVSNASAKRTLTKNGAINAVFFKRYYWSAYSRLDWDLPALTLTANANFLGSGRFTHPVAMRGITMREAARLQSFDDDFRFVTSDANVEDTSRIGIGMDMIGEAVPPLLAQAIANHLAKQLDGRSKSSQENFREAQEA